MKNSTVAIIVIILLIIFCVVFYLYHVEVSKKELEQTLDTAQKIYELNARIQELEDKLSDSDDVKENDELEKNVKFDSSKMK